MCVCFVGGRHEAAMKEHATASCTAARRHKCDRITLWLLTSNISVNFVQNE